jgi:glutaredoxin-related protein
LISVVCPFLLFAFGWKAYIPAADGDVVKQILTRLTGRATVPNILVHGESVGGSDDIADLHASNKLKPIFTEHGIRVKGQ